MHSLIRRPHPRIATAAAPPPQASPPRAENTAVFDGILRLHAPNGTLQVLVPPQGHKTGSPHITATTSVATPRRPSHPLLIKFHTFICPHLLFRASPRGSCEAGTSLALRVGLRWQRKIYDSLERSFSTALFQKFRDKFISTSTLTSPQAIPCPIFLPSGGTTRYYFD